MRVGFIGLGTMGLPMCLRLADKGFDLVVDDMDGHAVNSACKHPRINAASGSGPPVRVVVTMLPDGAAVRQALIGSKPMIQPSPVAQLLIPGTIVVEMSSSAPAHTRTLVEDLAHLDVSLIDAPVSGSPAIARRGELTLMVGGAPTEVEFASPILYALGRVYRVGGTAAGHTVKALNNMLAAINLAAAGEMLLIGNRLGVQPEALLDVINASSGRNHATESKIKQHVLSGAFGSGFRLALMLKDLQIAKDMADSAGLYTIFSEICVTLWENAEKDLGPDADSTETVRWLATHAGIQRGGLPLGGSVGR